MLEGLWVKFMLARMTSGCTLTAACGSDHDFLGAKSFIPAASDVYQVFIQVPDKSLALDFFSRSDQIALSAVQATHPI